MYVPIMVVVIVCNFVRLVCIMVILFGMGPYPFVTLCDDVVSFLDNPGECVGFCQFSNSDDFFANFSMALANSSPFQMEQRQGIV